MLIIKRNYSLILRPVARGQLQLVSGSLAMSLISVTSDFLVFGEAGRQIRLKLLMQGAGK